MTSRVVYGTTVAVVAIGGVVGLTTGHPILGTAALVVTALTLAPHVRVSKSEEQEVGGSSPLLPTTPDLRKPDPSCAAAAATKAATPLLSRSRFWIVASALFLAAWMAFPVGFVYLALTGPIVISKGGLDQRLAQVEGVRLMLPVELPDGYDPPAADDLRYDTDAAGRAISKWVTFPTGGRQDLDVVVWCVQQADNQEQSCAGPRHHPVVIRRSGDLQIVISCQNIPCHDGQVGDQWRTVNLTTNLDNVTWLD